MTHVPYKGPLPALTDVAGGHIAMMFSDVLNAMPLIQAGKLRVLAVNTSSRMAMLPDVPTLSELGLNGINLITSFMFFAPAATPNNITDKIATEVRNVLNDRDIHDEFARQGVIVAESAPPSRLHAQFKIEIGRWSELVERTGLAGSE